ncbi:MAG: hypothetical protein R2820_03965 [Cyclobacteriaceae bacterium]
MRFLILITVTLVCNLALGQDSKKYLKAKRNYNYREGYIIGLDSVRIDGLVKDDVLHESKKHSNVTFVHKDGLKKTYFPWELKGYGYTNHQFISYKKLFLEILESGKKVTLYKAVEVTVVSVGGLVGGGFGTLPPSSGKVKHEAYYLRRANEASFREVVKRAIFKDIYSEYFGDCEDLANEIREGRLKFDDLRRIVMKYNYCR